jgi:hypothetical protein
MEQINAIITSKLINKITKLKVFVLLLISLIVVNIPIVKHSYTECIEKQTLLVLQSNCSCNKWQEIIIVENHNCDKDYSSKHF